MSVSFRPAAYTATIAALERVALTSLIDNQNHFARIEIDHDVAHLIYHLQEDGTIVLYASFRAFSSCRARSV